MAHSYLDIVLFVTSVIFYQYDVISTKDSAPVFLIDHDSVIRHAALEANPFQKIGTAKFSSLIHDTIRHSDVILIFVEDTFCTEDTSMKDTQGTPYGHLRRALLNDSVKYLPAVQDPYTTLSRIFQLQPFNVHRIRAPNENMRTMFEGRFKYYYIFFNDINVNETRTETLKRHDAIMHKVYTAARRTSNGAVVAFYTGKRNPIVVVEKLKFVAFEPLDAPVVPSVIVASNVALFKFTGVYSSSKHRRSLFNQQPVVTDETVGRRSGKLSTRMAYDDFELQFNFSLRRDSWLIDSVALLEGGEEVGITRMGVGAPLKRSYVCADPLCIVNNRDGSLVVISQYQIQPLDDSLADDGADTQTPPASGPVRPTSVESFDPSVNCGPYFNAPIISCLFLSLILLSILFYAVIALYSCKSNDKYDDPQGKPLLLASVQI